MTVLRAGLLLLGVIASLMLGAAPTVSAETAPAPCHQEASLDPATADLEDARQSPENSGLSINFMGCCVISACIAAEPTSQAAVSTLMITHSPRHRAVESGLKPAPEHGPPRT